MAKQPFFDVLEDFMEMDSRPWKVKKNPIFSMPEAGGKTSFLNKSGPIAPHYDDGLTAGPRKKTVRKDAKAEKKKQEVKKIDIRKISLVRPDIPTIQPSVPQEPEPDQGAQSVSPAIPSEENSSFSLSAEPSAKTAAAPDDAAGNAPVQAESPVPAAEEPSAPKKDESEIHAEAASEIEEMDAESADAAEQTAAEPNLSQEGEEEQETSSFFFHEPDEQNEDQLQSDPGADSPVDPASIEKAKMASPISHLSLESIKSPSLEDILSSAQQTELFGEEANELTEASEPLYTGYSGTGSQPVINEKDLPDWAKEVLSQTRESDSVKLTSDGRRVWTFSDTEEEEHLSNSPFAALGESIVFEEEEEEPTPEDDSSLEEWADDYNEETEETAENESTEEAEELSASENDEIAAGDQDAEAISYPQIPDEEEAAQQLREEENRSEDEAKPEYQCSTYEIVSLIAYLIGVPKRIFENEYEPPKLEVYERLDTNRHARIIRHLCTCRTAIIRNYRQINDNMRLYHMSLNNMPDLVPIESLRQLSEDGVNFIRKTSTWPSHHIVEINKLINDRINNVKDIFPLWLNWNYVKNIFLMPNGSKDKGTKVASDLYYANKFSYPYQIYINWLPGEEGNILFNDKKFVSLLYQQNHDSFLQMNKVSDAGSFVKDSIYNYIEESDKLTVMVDCENSDPYRLCATFVNLDQEYLDKISRIILFDDLHASSAWKILEQYTSIPVEYILTKRVKEDKSLVDMKLATRACKEHYQNDVDSFIIVSSDSDYWGLIETLSDARFLVMVEREKCGADIKRALDENGIFYCYIDSFYSGNAAEIQNAALNMELNRMLHEEVSFNAKNLFKQALHNARLNLSPAEKQQYYNRHIKQMTLKIEDDGTVSVELKR